MNKKNKTAGCHPAALRAKCSTITKKLYTTRGIFGVASSEFVWDKVGFDHTKGREHEKERRSSF